MLTDDTYVYLIDIPGKVKEIVTPCVDGYTIYIDEKLNRQAQLKAYQHALSHIENADFQKVDASLIEMYAHEEKR